MSTVSETLAPTALCNDEDVRIYLGRGLDEIDDEDRATIIRLVNAASETFTDESQRLFKIDPALNPHERRFQVNAADLERGYLRIDDATDVVSVSSWDKRDGPSTGEAFTGFSTFTALPDEPIMELWLGYGTSLAAGFSVLSVTADWGWPKVPEKARQAVIYTAAEWFARDVEKFSATFSVEQGAIILPRVLPSQVLEIATSYRRWRVA